ncbi:hypothetical protein [Paraburkholderia sp. HP33-1]|nr:hypothetical protein [Paraburkholderia sp. HP33-1]
MRDNTPIVDADGRVEQNEMFDNFARLPEAESLKAEHRAVNRQRKAQFCDLLRCRFC